MKINDNVYFAKRPALKGKIVEIMPNGIIKVNFTDEDGILVKKGKMKKFEVGADDLIKFAKGSTVKGKSKGEIKIESYLPIFNGFYNTLFEANEEMYIEDPYDYDDYDFNYKKYNLDVAKACVEAIETELNNLDLDITVKFQALDSPREYNFRNDRIDVEYTLGADSLNKIHNFLEANKTFFAKYLQENYTSRSGFYSFHSNEANEWLDNIKNGTDLDHKLGASLDFILQSVKYTDEKLYYDVMDNVYLEADLKESAKGKKFADGGELGKLPYALKKRVENVKKKFGIDITKEMALQAYHWNTKDGMGGSGVGWQIFGQKFSMQEVSRLNKRDSQTVGDTAIVLGKHYSKYANGGNTTSGFNYSIGGL